MADLLFVVGLVAAALVVALFGHPIVTGRCTRRTISPPSTCRRASATRAAIPAPGWSSRRPMPMPMPPRKRFAAKRRVRKGRREPAPDTPGQGWHWRWRSSPAAVPGLEGM